MEDLIYASVTGLVQAIQAKEVSSVEVVQAYLERIEAVNPKLNAVVQLVAEPALGDARLADAALARGEVKGPLHGVPMTIKDSFETAGIVTTAGTKGLATYIPKQDATVVARLRSAGAILLGKTNTPEITLRFATDNYVYGRTNNPYDLERIPAGSSGGAAAIVAAGGSPFDIGSDTAGSIRFPAHSCGIAGLKPTVGRVPRTGHIPYLEFGATEAFTQVGPLARYVEDLNLILPIISGVDWRDPMIIPMPVEYSKLVDLKQLRVATYTDNGVTSPTAETANVVQAAASTLADMGAVVDEDRPPHMASAFDLWLAIFRADGGVGVQNLLQELGTQEMHPFLEWSQEAEAISTSEYIQLLARWNTFRGDSLAFLENYDVIVCPVTTMPATRHDEPTAFDYTRVYNLLGWPIAVVRCGTSPEGLPIGVQVVTHPWREDVALAAAQHLEKTFGGWQRPPL